MKTRSIATALIVGTVALVATACTSNPRTFNGGPVGGMVQEHGGGNPTPIIFPQSNY